MQRWQVGQQYLTGGHYYVWEAGQPCLPNTHLAAACARNIETSITQQTADTVIIPQRDVVMDHFDFPT